MKNTFLKLIGTAAMAILMMVMFAQIRVSAQQEQLPEDLTKRDQAQALEGSWDVRVTILNCQTGAVISSFPTLNTFMQGGTMQETSAGVPPSLRSPGHGV
jgi:hypothetical protein